MANEVHRGFEFWLVETTALGQQFWRIKFPGGHKTPPLPLASAAAVKAEIDKIIAEAEARNGAG